MRGKILFLIWGSGSGKSTVEKEFMENHADIYGWFNHVVSHATREPRIKDGEVHGVDYYFISEKEFYDMKDNNEFLQTAEHAGSYKGSTYEEWNNKLSNGNIIMPVLLSSAMDIKKELISKWLSTENDIKVIYFNISKEEVLNRLIYRYSKEFNISEEIFYNTFMSYTNSWLIVNENLKRTFDEIIHRLDDIEMLKPTANIADYIIDINEPRTKEDIYSEFIEIVNDIEHN